MISAPLSSVCSAKHVNSLSIRPIGSDGCRWSVHAFSRASQVFQSAIHGPNTIAGTWPPELWPSRLLPSSANERKTCLSHLSAFECKMALGLLKLKQRKREWKRTVRFNEKLLVTSAAVLSVFENCFAEYITILLGRRKKKNRKAEKVVRALSESSLCISLAELYRTGGALTRCRWIGRMSRCYLSASPDLPRVRTFIALTEAFYCILFARTACVTCWNALCGILACHNY